MNWICRKCETSNTQADSICEVCDAPRNGSRVASDEVRFHKSASTTTPSIGRGYLNLAGILILCISAISIGLKLELDQVQSRLVQATAESERKFSELQASLAESDKASQELKRSHETQVKELKARVTHAAIFGPVSGSRIILWNSKESDVRFSDSEQASFERSSIRYIYFSIDLKNNLAGIKDLKGDFGVKYIDPYGIVSTGKLAPNEKVVEGYTFVIPCNLVDLSSASYGWGNETGGTYDWGLHRIEFFWNGRKIGERAFTVH